MVNAPMPQTTGGSSWNGRRSSGPEKNVYIGITINHHFNSKIYADGAKIVGSVTITAQKDTVFDAIEVDFTGMTLTRVDMFHQMFPTQHTFLQLNMPIKRDCLPESRILEAGKTYSVPFTFVVPSRLPTNACRHNCREEKIKDKHLLLPPSMGHWEGNDLAPETAKVEYAIRAKVTLDHTRQGKSKVLESSKLVNVLPFCPSEGDLHVTSELEKYHTYQGKMIRQSVLSPIKGYLEASATLSDPVILSTDSLAASSSSIMINLSFIPNSANATPPKLSSRKVNITADTYFSTNPINCIPNLRSSAESRLWPILHYPVKQDVILTDTHEVIWEKKHSPKSFHKHSSEESHHLPKSQNTRRHVSGKKKPSSVLGSVEYVATLSLPFALPVVNKSIFLPTFHSCFVSRTYTIHVTLAEGSFSTPISLAIPLQIVTNHVNGEYHDKLPPYTPTESEEIVDLASPPSYGSHIRMQARV